MNSRMWFLAFQVLAIICLVVSIFTLNFVLFFCTVGASLLAYIVYVMQMRNTASHPCDEQAEEPANEPQPQDEEQPVRLANKKKKKKKAKKEAPLQKTAAEPVEEQQGRQAVRMLSSYQKKELAKHQTPLKLFRKKQSAVTHELRKHREHGHFGDVQKTSKTAYAELYARRRDRTATASSQAAENMRTRGVKLPEPVSARKNFVRALMKRKRMHPGRYLRRIVED